MATKAKAQANTAISENDFVPMVLWGRDHYSTLVYIETKLVEGPWSVRFDPHMRQKRRTFRVLAAGADPSLVRYHGVSMVPENGSRLSDGTYLPWHDDWDCVLDMLSAGLFAGNPDDWGDGFQLKLTANGLAAVAAIRQHKIGGGTFSNCGDAVIAAVESTDG